MLDSSTVQTAVAGISSQHTARILAPRSTRTGEWGSNPRPLAEGFTQAVFTQPAVLFDTKT